MISPVRRARVAVVPLAAAFLFAACGSSATPAPTTAVGPTVAPSAAGPASQAPASAAPSQAAGGGGAIPSGLFNQAPDLEAMLPSSACGAPVVKQSYAGNTSAAASANPMIGAFGALAGGGGAVSIALAESTTPSTCPVSFFAYRVQGVNATMFSTVLAAMAAGGSQVSLGGKTVTKLAESSGAVYFYVKGDILFGVSGATDAEAGQAISALP